MTQDTDSRPTGTEGNAANSAVEHNEGTYSSRRRWVMRLLAATLVPVLFLVLVELGLRAINYGYPTTYFVPRQIEGNRLPDSQSGSSRTSFSLRRLQGILFHRRMLAEKPEGTYRIFLFGESAAFGDPDPSYGVGRFLEALLEIRYPGMEFEVVNVAITAINSHVILPIARDCAQL